MELSRYTVAVAFSFDPKEQRRLDAKLKSIEAQLNKFGAKLNKSLGISIDKFSVDDKKLHFVLGNALDAASKKVTFEISNFVVNKVALAKALSGMTASVGVTGGSTVPGTSVTRKLSPEQQRRRDIRNAEFDRQQSAKRDIFDRRIALQAERLRLAETRIAQPHTQRIAGSAGVGGAVGGGLGSLFPGGGVLGAGLALAGGGYGLAALNQRNQQVVAAQLQTQAVVQHAGGTAQQGTQSFDFLRQQANRIGFNYLEAAPDFNKLLSGLTGAGVSVEESQNVFKGFAELARVNKLGRVEQNRLFRALSQVAGKGKLQAEELTGQIAEALPGGTALFARAYQKQIGGNLVGKEAIAALMDAMKKGQVKSDILTFAAQLASQQAQPGLAAASTASQAEQARFQNVTSDMAILASQKGVEEGFARIFRTLNNGLSESGPLVTKLAQGFNEATKWADDLILFPQSFARALEGKDSLVADWLGSESINQMNEDLKLLKQTFVDLNSLVEGGNFMPTLKSTAQEIAAITNFFANTARWFKNASASADIVQADVASRGKTPLGNIMAGFAGSFAGLSTFVSTPWDAEGADMYRAWAEENYPRGAQSLVDQKAIEKAISNTANNFQISITVDPVTLANMDVSTQAQALADQFVMNLGNVFETTMIQFPVKE